MLQQSAYAIKKCMSTRSTHYILY